MGGGTLPKNQFSTVVLYIKGKADALERAFREHHLIGRIENDKFLIDFRSILPQLDPQIVEICQKVILR